MGKSKKQFWHGKPIWVVSGRHMSFLSIYRYLTHHYTIIDVLIRDIMKRTNGSEFCYPNLQS